jgi:hypothetical protein
MIEIRAGGYEPVGTARRLTMKGVKPAECRVTPTEMGQETLDGTDLTALRAEYRWKVTDELPRVAQASDGWPIHLDHCFGRVVLDNLFADEWYDHVDGSPAYEQLSQTQLEEAIAIADRMLEEGRPAVEELNDNSLRWRGKLED